MKWLALILLISNLGVAGFFLVADFWPSAPLEVNAPLNVERLSLRSSSRPPSAAPRLPNKAPSSALCVEWRGLEPADFTRAREQLKNMTSNHVMSFTEVPLNTYQWVVFPPLPSRTAAVAKLAELTEIGIDDIFIVQEGIWTNALSLGLYVNVETARRRTRELEEKGVHGTRIEIQPKPDTAYYFMIRSDDANALKSLNEAKTAYPNSALSRVACHTAR